jgi:hypothetical protein
MDNEFDDVGYPEDWESQYGAGSDDGWDMARADGCESCGIGADELDMSRSGFMGRDYVIFCPYCGDAVAGGTDTVISRARAIFKAVVGYPHQLVGRVFRRSASDGGDVDNMGEIPF